MTLNRTLGADLNARGPRLTALAVLTVRGQATTLFRVSQLLGSRFPVLGNLVKQWNHLLTGCDISWHATVGPGLKLYHPTGVVIGPWVVMGSNCEFQQGVTLGGAGFGVTRGEPDPSPTIGNNVKFGSGAKAFGSITIGDNAVLGANCVLVRDAAPGAVILGVPGRPHERTSSESPEADDRGATRDD
ncbi:MULTISPECIES: serine O-acetyltransferase [Propionibacteriaceae]|uniref:serine O-acetyltransferase n=1 Tax=Propionibacteriaceae TaxID=31957 RepID=UPI0005429B28|nr:MULTISPECIES: serine acetyltransferase [Propionibacteriaceae]MDN5996513.1 serine acetyltransferase [Acidipropionibacterium jensenii]MDN6624017.1 serine acetyltransferase [Acidipropionibacterium jensenii]MDN6655137.1 serine acetyltransferase [Bifidobacterium crudilactis]CEH02882.1 Serine O-acetyltransferase [Propionibacterium freudenreichii]